MNLKLMVSFIWKVTVSTMFLISLICVNQSGTNAEQIENQRNLNMGSCLSPAWMPWKDSKCVILVDSLLTYENARKWCMGLGDAVYWSTSLLELEDPEDLNMLREILTNYTNYGGNLHSFWISTKKDIGSFQPQPLELGRCQHYIFNRPTTTDVAAGSDIQVGQRIADTKFFPQGDSEGSSDQDGSAQSFIGSSGSGSGSGDYISGMEAISSGSGSGSGDYFEPTPISADLIENFLAMDFCSVKKPFICESPQHLSLPMVVMTLTKMEEKAHEKDAEILKNANVIGKLVHTINGTFNLRDTIDAKNDEVTKKVINLEQRFESKLSQMKKDLEKLVESLESIIPVGFVYVQLPNQPGPNEIWPKYKWEHISYQHPGLFFRTVGGNAASFGQIQEDNSPKLSQVRSERSASSPAYSVRINSAGQWSDSVVSGSIGSRRLYYGLQFYMSGGEVRPRNMAVKLWQRTKR